ncbi:hypothetical protein PR202_gb15777 [Eleusine coracana subsp. coracana]|uniref:Uncharacterized protein n=1 Tax=Eleusine coracana subsp. coracana TaxID=191504 RepID=A0AAV5EYQ8_ELECO|nr:hypothetical protein QOZ80_4BG0350300 [Eleusine coracana subsp. coracana]GJN27731.1 hypothetical protein PR202_gb15777 [Eleusine coracana subsp. coracana]
MEEKAAGDAAAAVAAAAAAAADQDGAVYCSEHPYPPGATAAAGTGAGGICAFCLQEKLGMLVSSSKSSPFHPPPPPVSASPSSPPSTVSQPPPPPLLPSQKAMPPSQKTKSSSSSAAPATGGLKRSKSVAPRPEEGPLAPAPAITADSPRKKSFWSFLHLSSSSSSSSHKSSAASSTTATTNNSSGGGAARRNSVSVASASSASLGGRLEAIAEPAESPGRRSEGSSSSSFGRKVARSRSVGCGSRSFSGDFLERLSNGFGDCALRRVESHREPKPNNSKLAHLGGVAAHDEDEHAKHRIKCAGFFGGGMGAAAPPPSSSSYWLSAPDGGGGSSGSGGSRGSRSHRSWAWALASPMRALRPASSASSSKTIMAAPHGRNNGNMAAVATS